MVWPELNVITETSVSFVNVMIKLQISLKAGNS